MTGRAATDATPQRAREIFLKELRRRGNVSDAATKAAIDRSTAYRWREAESEFAAAWDVAIEAAVEGLESEAWRRAKEGTLKPVYGRVAKDQDGKIGTIREYSDGLLTTLLKAHRPEKYRERVGLDAILKYVDLSKLDPEQLERLAQGDDLGAILFRS